MYLNNNNNNNNTHPLPQNPTNTSPTWTTTAHQLHIEPQDHAVASNHKQHKSFRFTHTFIYICK